MSTMTWPDVPVRPDDEYVWSRELTDEELQKFRKDRMQYLADQSFSYLKDKTFTCDTCGFVKSCVFAWDLYNTDGDCLASK